MPDKFIFANYIVRIYRFKKDDPRGLVGVVEEVGVKGKKAFTNYDELWEILNTLTAPSSARPSGRWEIPAVRKGSKEKKGI